MLVLDVAAARARSRVLEKLNARCNTRELERKPIRANHVKLNEHWSHSSTRWAICVSQLPYAQLLQQW
jgi:hypothetical protein